MYGEALDLLTKTQKLAPKDQVVAALTKETRKKAVLAQDREKQERIDQLVKQLLESMKSPHRTLPSDGWTSPPLTLWIMDLNTQGYSLQEGEDRLLVSGITDNLLQHGRVQIVERAVLDRLLEELKLGTSKLIDRSAALDLGRILAARLILTGQLTYLGPQTQVSLRLIETETGRITAAINESFGSAVPASFLATKVSEDLVNRLRKVYPIRGKVSRIEGGSIKLNIGQKAGVGMGQRFKAVNTDVRLEIIAVEPDTSTAKIITGEKGLEEEQRLEAL